jgi:hypothetical protein
VTAKPGADATGGVHAAVVLGDDFDVLVALPAVNLVLDPDIGDVDAIVEVRERMVMCPFLNLMRVSGRAPVTVLAPPIGLLEKRLILTLEVLFENHTTNVRALLTEALLRPEIGAVEGRVMGQLTGPAHATMEGLGARVMVPSMRLEQATATFGERHHALAAVKGHGANQSLLAEVLQTGVADIGRWIARVAQVPFRHNPEGTCGRQCAALVAVDLVGAVALQHDLTLESTRKFQAVEKHLTWIATTRARILIGRSITSRVRFVGVIV